MGTGAKKKKRGPGCGGFCINFEEILVSDAPPGWTFVPHAGGYAICSKQKVEVPFSHALVFMVRVSGLGFRLLGFGFDL